MNQPQTSEQQLEIHRNIHRVACNLQVLLDIGLFPGKHSLGLEECKGFVNNIIADAKKALDPKIEPPPTANPAANGQAK